MDCTHRPNENALNMRLSRYWRPAYSLLSWHGTGTSTKEVGILALLSRAQRASNTTRGTTPGLIDPNLGEAGGRVTHPIPRNGRGQGRARRTIATPSSTEGDEGQSDISEETSDDSSSQPEEDEKEDEEDEVAIEGEDGEVYKEVDAIEELDPDEEQGLHAADGQESDKYEELLANAEEEYHSDLSLHSIIQVAGRRTTSSGPVGFRGFLESAIEEEHKEVGERRQSTVETGNMQRNASPPTIDEIKRMLIQRHTGQPLCSRKRFKHRQPCKYFE